MKLVFAAGTLTLMMIAGTSSTAAAAQWRGGYSHAGHGHHYRAAHLGARGYGYGVRRYGAGYGRGYGGYGYARRSYGGGFGYATRGYGGDYGPSYSGNGYSHNGYAHSSAYSAGFNRGAEAQWLVNMQSRWAYDYAHY